MRGHDNGRYSDDFDLDLYFERGLDALRALGRKDIAVSRADAKPAGFATGED